MTQNIDKQLPYETLMAYLDGELPEPERRAFEELLDSHPEWQDEVQQYANVVAATGHLKVRPPQPQLWDNYWEEIDSALQKRLGWVLLLIGGLIISIWGVYKVVSYADNPYAKLGIILLLIGMVLLFGAVLRGWLIERGRERYRRIRR